MLFRQIVFKALLVGLLSGAALTVVQFWQVIPIIQQAESYEANTGVAHTDNGHEHSIAEWTPAEGVQRNSFTLLANVLTAIGLAMLFLVVIITAIKSNEKTQLDWRHGLLWGAAGYAIFYLVPSLGVPPKIPGSISAALEVRQLWWLIAVVCTSAGLAGLAFMKSPSRWLAPLLIVVPFLTGVPQAPSGVMTDLSPAVIAEQAELTRQFFGATAIANAVFWLVLGIAAVWSARKIKTNMNNDFS